MFRMGSGVALELPNAFDVLYMPILNACALACLLLGLTALLWPAVFRRILEVTGSNSVPAVVGGILLLMGATLSVALAPEEAIYGSRVVVYPVLGFALGILTLLKGAFFLVAPGWLRRILQFHLARGNGWMRAMGALSLAAAFFFWMAALQETVTPPYAIP